MKLKKKSPTYETFVERTAYGQVLEVPIEVTYSVEPGEKEIRYGDNATPGCAATVTIEEVYVPASGEHLSLTEHEADCIKDAILDDLAQPPDEGY
jgi:outer membrane translocation and assembly module TamA